MEQDCHSRSLELSVVSHIKVYSSGEDIAILHNSSLSWLNVKTYFSIEKGKNND